MDQDDPPMAQHAAHPGKPRGKAVSIPMNIKLCMADHRIFTAAMAAEYGGMPVDVRRDLDRLVLLGVLARRTQERGGVVVYFAKT